MAEDSSDATLIKIAIFGVAMSILSTAFIGVLFVNNGDYDYDQITNYRNELAEFSGETMLNQTPWVLTHVYTPWSNNYPVNQSDSDGWLYGEEIENYPYLGNSADIKLSPDHKSSRPIGFTMDATTATIQDGYKWWATTDNIGGFLVRPFAKFAINFNLADPYTYSDRNFNNWEFTGYRYVFDPTLPFSTGENTRDGSLSIVWYNFGSDGAEGLSGGLDVYGGEVLLASYSATDIIADYRSESGYATTYDFVFDGTPLVLSVRFDQSAIASGMSFMQAWTQGNWSMAISSASAGNFFDIDGSSSFTTTAGGMIQTFINIYTFSMPNIENPWAELVLWLMVGLPMTMAMLFITLRLINGFRVL